MAKLQRYGYSGDPDPNGEFFLARDVSELEDQVEAMRKAVAVTDERFRVLMLRQPSLFGYVDPDEARAFLTGGLREVVVSRVKTEERVMPLSFGRGPRKYSKRPELPHIRTRVSVGRLKGRVTGHDGGALVIRMDNGETITTTEWERVNDAKRDAKRGSDLNGSIARRRDKAAQCEAGDTQPPQCASGRQDPGVAQGSRSEGRAALHGQ